MRRLQALVEMRTAESNRLAAANTTSAVSASIEEHLAHLDTQIKRTEQLIREHIDNHPQLKQQSQLLDSIPGIAATTAAVILAEVADVTQYRSARQLAAYAGLVPRERQSGSSVRGRTRLSKIGNARLRKALYFPAITALRCSPLFQAWAKGLRERGKCKMSVIGAGVAPSSCISLTACSRPANRSIPNGQKKRAPLDSQHSISAAARTARVKRKDDA